MAIETTITMSRDEWKTRTEVKSKMTADKTHYYLKAHLDAYENDQIMLSRTWDEKISRTDQLFYNTSYNMFKPTLNEHKEENSMLIADKISHHI